MRSLLVAVAICNLTPSFAIAAENEDNAIRFIQDLGGKFRRDEKLPGSPIIEVDLIRTDVTDADLKELAQLKRLRILSLYGRRVTGVGLKALADLGELSSLDLSYADITDEGLKEIAQLKKLQSLKLKGVRQITLAGIKHLSALKELRSLSLCQTHADDTWLKPLVNLKEIRALDISEIPITDEGVEDLMGFKHLEELNLHYTKCTDQGVNMLTKLSNLRAVELSSTELTDAGLASLTSLKDLQKLDVSLTKVTEAGLRKFPPNDKLRSLNAIGVKLSTEGFKHIAKFKLLESLAMTSITDDGLKEIIQLEEMTDLFIGRANITEKTFRDLVRLKKLNTLHFFDRPKVSESAIRDLRKAFPKALIIIPE